MMKTWNEHIENLLLEKEFDELSAAEMTAVLAVMTASEYNDLRRSLLYVQAEAKAPVAFPQEKAVLENLKSALVKAPAQSWLRRSVQIKTAAWKTAVFTLFCCAATAWFCSTPRNNVPVLKEITTLRDTILEKVYLKDTIYIKNNIYIKIPVRQPVNYNADMAFSTLALPAPGPVVSIDTMPSMQTGKIEAGISLKDAPELNVFFTGVQ